MIEFNIPSTSKRVDFIITGKNEKGSDNYVVVELKQWDSAEATEKEDVVRSFVGGKVREVAHPSYQSWSYRQFMEDMNEAIYSNDITGYSCAYLHNYKGSVPEPLKGQQYSKYIDEAPLFFSDDSMKLQEFLRRHVGKGSGMHLMYQIENGKIRPSKKLIDHVDSLFKGNSSFVMLDEQKVAYETIMNLARKQGEKRSIIIQGGPGTGKSVISVNVLGGLLRSKLNVKFVAPNASFRNVMVNKLVSQNPKDRTRIKNLFSGSGSFYSDPIDLFDVLIVDEAHRLKQQGAFQYWGENQVKDIIKASKVSVFFIDDSQRIRPEDVGSVEEIKKYAAEYGAEVHELQLNAQFRCSGATGFIQWVDNVLQLRETGNYDGWDKESFEFKICDTPNEVHETIKGKVREGYNARMLAGYAWEWTAENKGNRNGEVADVTIQEHGFEMPWNGRSISTDWAVHEGGLNQIGCVHTSQGLEFDYAGVIIGDDLIYESATMKLKADYNAYRDKVGKKGLKKEPEKLAELVKNVYRILMSRGMKGCYVFCRDPAVQQYLKRVMS
ncbi:DUF2075 domain-containing protein [Cohnella kolymensis]|uniref:DUF2075 domain-containing protein n=1 Tax=Cohnella kolymensis TaxID=1590652 RepID=UPI00190F2A1C|nr:DUF2075 domain-containing protein [Cohnella kolymensis]